MNSDSEGTQIKQSTKASGGLDMKTKALKRICVDTRRTTYLKILSDKRALAQKSADYRRY